MANLINKATLVAEIKERIDSLFENNDRIYDEYGNYYYKNSENDYRFYHKIDEDNWDEDRLSLSEVTERLFSVNSIKVNNVWHDANETPKGAGDKEILVQFADSHASVLEIDDWEYLDHQTKWAYLKDLI